MSPPSTFPEALLMMTEQLLPLGEAVDGYRKQAEARGYSPTAAEATALELHSALLRTMFRQVAKL